jgi:hypothetical protein
MNKFTKYAIEKLCNEETPERDDFVDSAFASHEFRAALSKQPKIAEKKARNDAVNYAVKRRLELNTANGMRNCYVEYGIDRLAVGDFHLPIPQFFFSDKSGCYSPGFEIFQLNHVMGRYHYKSYKREVVIKWALVKDYLLQPAYKKSRSLMNPVLEIERGDHVYFMLDGEGRDIKIGVSNQLMTRYRYFNNGSTGKNIQVLKIIDVGGYDLEAALHQFFGRHRYQRTEWFADHEDIRNFIKKLDAGEDPWKLINEGLAA